MILYLMQKHCHRYRYVLDISTGYVILNIDPNITKDFIFNLELLLQWNEVKGKSFNSVKNILITKRNVSK